jgi:hypothetical protein
VKNRIGSTLNGLLLLTLCICAGPVRASAQAGPGPIRQPSQPAAVDPISPAKASKADTPKLAHKQRGPREFSGSWTLNRDESDDPRKKMEDARASNGGNGGNGGGSRRTGIGFPGGGYPGGGGGYPGGGGNRGGRGGGQTNNPRDLQEAFPANALTITQKDIEVDLLDDRGHRQIFYTDGRKLEKSKDGSHQECSAKWEDNRLMCEDKTSSGHKITRTFELSSGGDYLYETVRVEGGRGGSSVYLRYVYDVGADEKP